MKAYGDLVGQSRNVELLRNFRRRLSDDAAKSMSPLMLVGPDGSGKLTLAKLFAQAVCCENVVAGADPCGCCGSCEGVSRNHSLAYFEFESRSHGSYENVWKLLNTTSVTRRTVILVKYPELLAAGVADVFLKSLEEPRQRTFVFVSSEEERVSPTIISRCTIRHMVPQSPESIAVWLSGLCDLWKINYQAEAVALLALAAEGWIGRGRRFLEETARSGSVTVTNVRSALGLPDDADVVAFSLALLRGDLEDAYRLSEGLGRNGLAAVQSFFRSCFVRYCVRSNVRLEPALSMKEITQESWRIIDHEWSELAQKRTLSVADSARYAMLYWSKERNPVRWEAVLVRFQALLRPRAIVLPNTSYIDKPKA